MKGNTFDYDSSGNLSSSTDANNFTRNFTYDANGNQTNTSYTWVGPGVTNTVTTSTLYDAQGRVIQTIDADGNTNQTFYNAAGKVDHTIEKFGNTSSFIYDAQGNNIQSTYADGTFTRTVYDSNARPILTADRNGITGTLTQYDPVGRVTNTIRFLNVAVNIITDPNNLGQMMSVIATSGTPFSTNSTTYFPNGWVQSRTDAAGQTTSYTYWPDGQLETTTDPLYNVTFYAYDDAGRRSQMRDALGRISQFQYDVVGRSIATIFADNTYTSNYFNGLGQSAAQIDQAGLTNQFAFDISGQLTNVTKPQVLDPENGNNPTSPAWSYAFDQYERPSTMTDPKGRTNTFSYDAQGRQIAHFLPLAQMESNVYNSFSQFSTQYDFKGQWTQFLYDHLGRVKAKYRFGAGSNTPSEAVCYLYDPLGRVSQITQRYGADATTNACDGYATLFGPVGRFPRPGDSLLVGLVRLLGEPVGRVPSRGAAPSQRPPTFGVFAIFCGNLPLQLTGLALLLLAMLSMLAKMKRRLVFGYFEYFVGKLRSLSLLLCGQPSRISVHSRPFAVPLAYAQLADHEFRPSVPPCGSFGLTSHAALSNSSTSSSVVCENSW